MFRGKESRLRKIVIMNFKEVKGDNPVRSISSIVDEYAVAFLNIGRKGVGRVYWGVSDDRKVVGVKFRSQ